MLSRLSKSVKKLQRLLRRLRRKFQITRAGVSARTLRVFLYVYVRVSYSECTGMDCCHTTLRNYSVEILSFL